MAVPIKIAATVMAVVAHGRSVYSIQVETSRKIPRYMPGQFLHLAIDDYDPAGGFWPESRVFSIAASDGEKSLTVIYSVKGSYTRKMEEYLAPGKTVWLKLPYGNFIIDPNEAMDKRLVLVAGGTGIAPYAPFLEKCLEDKRVDLDIRLYYGVRNASLLLFSDLIVRCTQALPNFVCRLYVEEGTRESVDSSLGGILDIDAIAGEAIGGRACLYYLSGPPGMISSFRGNLLGRGIPAESIRVDDWE
jgi:NAD(P)H-flavin reductase